MVFEVKIITVFGANDQKAHRDSQGTGNILFLCIGSWLHEFIKVYTLRIYAFFFMYTILQQNVFLEIVQKLCPPDCPIANSLTWFESSIALSLGLDKCPSPLHAFLFSQAFEHVSGADVVLFPTTDELKSGQFCPLGGLAYHFPGSPSQSLSPSRRIFQTPEDWQDYGKLFREQTHVLGEIYV